MTRTRLRLLLLAAVVLPGVARAEIAVSANDAHTTFDNGAMVGSRTAGNDTVAVIDLAQSPPRVVSTLDVPSSVVGPPISVAVGRDESFAVVTSSTKVDPALPSRLGPNDQVTVVDLTSKPPAVVQRLKAGAGAGGMRLSPDGSLLLVSNRFDGSVSVFTVAGARLTAAGTVMIDPGCQPAGIGFAGNGEAALVSCRLQDKVVVLHVKGTSVTPDPRPITTGVGPYNIMVNPAGTLAAVGNVGRSDGDVDTVSLIDLTQTPFRAVQSTMIGRGPEGLRWSPDGRFLALDTQEGTTKPPGNPFRRESGRLQMFEVKDHQLRFITEAPLGHWSHGIVFSRDGRTVLVQNMVEKTIQVFGWDGATLAPKPSIELDVGPAALNTAWP